MKKVMIRSVIFIGLTLLTQIGGLVYLLALLVSNSLFKGYLDKKKAQNLAIFIGLYVLFTYLIVPITAPIFGREKINNTDKIQPTNQLTILLNRNYVDPKINTVLAETTHRLKETDININYLDANFPFINHFPLLPHLSHNDGKKIDISFIYAQADGTISRKQTSRLGYGVYVEPKANEKNQPKVCIDAGHLQYDYSKYLSMGSINQDLVFSTQGTRTLLTSLLANKSINKVFIEPHLKQRMALTDSRVRYHDCHAVRHDDHIHLQIK